MIKSNRLAPDYRVRLSHFSNWETRPCRSQRRRRGVSRQRCHRLLPPDHDAYGIPAPQPRSSPRFVHFRDQSGVLLRPCSRLADQAMTTISGDLNTWICLAGGGERGAAGNLLTQSGVF